MAKAALEMLHLSKIQIINPNMLMNMSHNEQTLHKAIRYICQ